MENLMISNDMNGIQYANVKNKSGIMMNTIKKLERMIYQFLYISALYISLICYNNITQTKFFK